MPGRWVHAVEELDFLDFGQPELLISYNALHKLLGHDHLFLLGRIELLAQHGLEQGLLVDDRCLYLKC